MGYDLREHGQPVVDSATCTRCGACVRICIDEVLKLVDGKIQPTPGLFMGCIACGHCMAVCPTGSIAIHGRDMKPADRIPLPPADGRATPEQLESLATARRSIRRFTTQGVPRETLERIVRIASTAPMGISPHDVGVVVFDTSAKVQTFAEESCLVFARVNRFLNPVVLGLLRPFMGKARYDGFHDFIRPLFKTLVAERRAGRDLFTYNAPAAMLFHGDPGDSMIVATYAMLAAESLGLGSCMLGSTVALSQDKRMKAKYGIPPQNKVGVALVLGYPDVRFRHALRRRLESVHFAGFE